MAALSLSNAPARPHDTSRFPVGARFAAALLPAAVLVGLWGDYARSVIIGDALQPVIETAAQAAAAVTGEGRGRVVASFEADLRARPELRQVEVDVLANRDRTLTVQVRAQVPSAFLPILTSSFGIERSATVPALVRLD